MLACLVTGEQHPLPIVNGTTANAPQVMSVSGTAQSWGHSAPRRHAEAQFRGRTIENVGQFYARGNQMTLLRALLICSPKPNTEGVYSPSLPFRARTPAFSAVWKLDWWKEQFTEIRFGGYLGLVTPSYHRRTRCSGFSSSLLDDETIRNFLRSKIAPSLGKAGRRSGNIREGE